MSRWPKLSIIASGTRFTRYINDSNVRWCLVQEPRERSGSVLIFLERNGKAPCLEVRMESFLFDVWLVKYDPNHSGPFSSVPA
jgi:hypothetical protein